MNQRILLQLRCGLPVKINFRDFHENKKCGGKWKINELKTHSPLGDPGKRPEYRLLDDAEVKLTIFAAQSPHGEE